MTPSFSSLHFNIDQSLLLPVVKLDTKTKMPYIFYFRTNLSFNQMIYSLLSLYIIYSHMLLKNLQYNQVFWNFSRKVCETHKLYSTMNNEKKSSYLHYNINQSLFLVNA